MIIVRRIQSDNLLPTAVQVIKVNTILIFLKKKKSDEGENGPKMEMIRRKGSSLRMHFRRCNVVMCGRGINHRLIGQKSAAFFFLFASALSEPLPRWRLFGPSLTSICCDGCWCHSTRTRRRICKFLKENFRRNLRKMRDTRCKLSLIRLKLIKFG